MDRVRKLGDFIKKFNLYTENENLSQTDQLISTRLFTLFLFFSILIIVLSTSFIGQTNLVTIDLPSEDVFNQLSIKYRQTFLLSLTKEVSVNIGQSIIVL
ncbi:hypothetical protein I4U23_016217 [Adineta vaga]|nr:hypothetical protein I4U23_016217 [Adineta vaga]